MCIEHAGGMFIRQCAHGTIPLTGSYDLRSAGARFGLRPLLFCGWLQKTAEKAQNM